jgi:hypothetical protein
MSESDKAAPQRVGFTDQNGEVAFYLPLEADSEDLELADKLTGVFAQMREQSHKDKEMPLENALEAAAAYRYIVELLMDDPRKEAKEAIAVLGTIASHSYLLLSEEDRTKARMLLPELIAENEAAATNPEAESKGSPEETLETKADEIREE